MNVSEVMTKKVKTISPSSRFKDLWKYIVKQHINAVPVVDGHKKLLGIVTKQDILERLFPDYKEYFESISGSDDIEPLEKDVEEIFNLKISVVMRKRVIFTTPETLIMRALARMIARRVDQLPVLNEHGKVVGLVTKSDIFYALYKFHQKFITFRHTK